MNKYRREISIEILVGLFMFTVLIALGVFTIVLSRENLFRKTYLYEFVFTEVGGLRAGDNVYLRGMNIGRVKQTTLEEGRVRVYATLDFPVALRRGYKIEVANSSMLGGKHLNIYEGPDDAPALGDNVTLLGAKPIDLLGEVGRAISGLQALINAVGEGQGTLGKLMNDEAVYDNLAAASKDFKTVIGRIEQGEGTLGKLLRDDRIHGDVEALMANLREISDRLAGGQGTLGKLLAEDSGGLYDDLGATLASIRGISESIGAGEGTLGRLVHDAQLYDEAVSLIEDMRAAVDDLREASPITSFSSVLFGAF